MNITVGVDRSEHGMVALVPARERTDRGRFDCVVQPRGGRYLPDKRPVGIEYGCPNAGTAPGLVR